MLTKFKIRSQKRQELINITTKIKEIVEESGVNNGICVVYIPHTTAGIIINESADSDVVRDIQKKLSSLIPEKEDYLHTEGNSDAHIKSSIVGPSETSIIDKGELLLGTWQGIFFCEFDGPRERNVFVKIIK